MMFDELPGAPIKASLLRILPVDWKIGQASGVSPSECCFKILAAVWEYILTPGTVIIPGMQVRQKGIDQ